MNRCVTFAMLLAVIPCGAYCGNDFDADNVNLKYFDDASGLCWGELHVKNAQTGEARLGEFLIKGSHIVKFSKPEVTLHLQNFGLGDISEFAEPMKALSNCGDLIPFTFISGDKTVLVVKGHKPRSFGSEKDKKFAIRIKDASILRAGEPTLTTREAYITYTNTDGVGTWEFRTSVDQPVTFYKSN